MPIQAFIDDSGVKGTDRHFVFAGQMAEEFMWADFASDWRAALAESPSIPYFKMHEAVHRAKCFRGWSETQRDDKLYRLARVISRHGFEAIHCTTDLAHHAEHWGKTARCFRDPYFVSFFTVAIGICSSLADAGRTSQCDIVFDEHAIFGPRVTRWYPVVRAAITHQDPALDRVMPDKIRFETDAEQMPLQAADMVAWFFRRRASGAPETALDWLLPTVFTVPISKYSSALIGPEWVSRVSETWTPSVIDAIGKAYDELTGL